VRLAAGRNDISDELQALCFLAGANSIFYGEKLLTTGNPDAAHDRLLFARLQIAAEPAVQPRAEGPHAQTGSKVESSDNLSVKGRESGHVAS
jgi:biotin synthase